MKVLITGSSGQLGEAIACQLEANHSIFGLDILPGTRTTSVGSIVDRQLVFHLVSQVDAVIHTAALHAPHVGHHSKKDFIDVNIQGTLHLLEAAVKYKLQRFVFTSSTSVYGHTLEPSHKAVWVTEDLIPKPRDIYDITKLAAEQLCQNISREHFLTTVCLRIGRFWEEPLPERAIYRLYRGLDVRDAAKAHQLALEQDKMLFSLFNISGDSPFQKTDLKELWQNASQVIDKYHPEAQYIFKEKGWRLPKKIDRVYIIDRAKEMLGYQPNYNFKELLNSL